ncbi:hypothetical protein FPV67DRAFT_1614578 [Lyophyllum atratum]|nr:hypothetical protein FPV67DRAFT_1614578 [Lyophyllum atratum]
MGQYFEFINLDNPFPVRTSVGGKFGEFFWDISDMTDREVMQALWRPEESHKFRVVTIEPYSQLKRPEKRLDILDRYTVFPEESLANATLPIELVSMILEEVEDLADIVCFVLTCQRYFEIGRPILEARSEEILTYSWAGNRLICAGDYAMIDDLPEGMLTEYEKKLLDEKFGTDNTDDVWEQLSFVQSLQPDWHLNQKRTTLHTRHVKRLFHHFMDLRMPYRTASKNVPPRMALAGTRDFAVLTELTVELEDTPRDLPYGLSQTYESYVLRNLTTKEYIRGAAIREAWNTPDMPYLRALRFMHLLVLRITWSQDSSLTIAYEGPIQVHRGVWAGHRFDFCDIKTVEDGQGTMGDWSDVSKVVIDELVAVFEEEADDLNDRSSDWD